MVASNTLKMMFLLTAFLPLTTIISFPSMANARPLVNHHLGGSSLAARLKVEDQSSNCWGSLFQLQACTGEVVLFFLNGETYLGPSCCQAIRVIEHECWPDMLGSLGFTTEEGDILQGYCDASAHPPPAQPSPPTTVAAVRAFSSANLVP